jgi:hypothetical protein
VELSVRGVCVSAVYLVSAGWDPPQPAVHPNTSSPSPRMSERFMRNLRRNEPGEWIWPAQTALVTGTTPGRRFLRPPATAVARPWLLASFRQAQRCWAD